MRLADLEHDLARLRELHAQLAASGLTKGELDRLNEAHGRLDYQFYHLDAIFGELERDGTWLTEIDFERWYELGCRERTHGLSRTEAQEVLEFRRRYVEALASGREPTGECYIVHYKPIRYTDGEEG